MEKCRVRKLYVKVLNAFVCFGGQNLSGRPEKQREVTCLATSGVRIQINREKYEKICILSFSLIHKSNAIIANDSAVDVCTLAVGCKKNGD